MPETTSNTILNFRNNDSFNNQNIEENNEATNSNITLNEGNNDIINNQFINEEEIILNFETINRINK